MKGFLRGRRAVVLVVIVLAALCTLLYSRSSEKRDEGGIDTEIAELCSLVDGVGECYVSVVLVDGDEGRVYSIAVVCEGADSIRVRADLTELLTSHFGIGANRVSIVKMKK
jgi:hypothetical protein